MAVSVLFRRFCASRFSISSPRAASTCTRRFFRSNRGAYPNIWSIVEKTPAGVTLHYIDEGLYA